jgi:hypothetical protein
LLQAIGNIFVEGNVVEQRMLLEKILLKAMDILMKMALPLEI